MTTPTLLRVGLDIGGTKTEAVALDPNGRLVGRLRMPTELGAERVLATAERAVRGLSFQTGRPLSAFASIGIGIPGAVDRETGEVRHAFNLDLAELQLGSLLSELVGVPVRVENDVTAAALGANHLLELDGTIAYLNLGTGLAAGIVVDGAPWRGAHGVAGEIGHLPIDPNGYACPCGQFGCLETVASGSAISRAWPHGGEHPAQDVVRAMEAGDVEAAAVVARLVQGAASCVRVLALSLDPQSIIIGGGLRLLGEPLIGGIRATLEQWAEQSSFLAALDLPRRVRVLPKHSSAAAVGAAIIGA
ncbi:MULTISPECIES: ROK family protein [unclassified Leucobacter]|uniref:ROK family protein n=1 Tax=unclassified Leucobacter TaxID=2621730 RepID=UPI00165DB469|nr:MULTISPECIES: ROK family protein [unclassified Leucobacter]MBC9927720.1 ROK family protein [Leucobacter sp. cx-169]